MDCLNEDITLSVRRWHGNVDYYDILLYSAYLYKERAPSQLHGQVAIAIIASLAMWDSEVAERLAREDLQTIFHPLPFLIDMAVERGWAGDQDCSWCEGQLNVFNCDERMHSVMAALKQPKEIERRIWSAQIGVLMPYVEQGRQYVIDRIRSYLKVPYMTSYGTVVDNLHDLEIGQIENQIHERGVYIDSEIYQLVKRLRKIRNLLAHLEIVDLDLLADSNVVNAI